MGPTKAVKKELWDDTASNAEQRYLTHGAFRYFGKLPPTLTGRILDELGVGRGTHVVDLMCGSGTTLIEAVLRGARATGCDCNDISALIARVKTTPIPEVEQQTLQQQFRRHFGSYLDSKWVDEEPGLFADDLLDMLPEASDPPPIRNFDHWFSPTATRLLCLVRDWVKSLPEGELANLATVAFIATIRPSSRASVRTGRIFHDREKRIPNPAVEFLTRLCKICDALKELSGDKRWKTGRVRVHVTDARESGLRKGSADVIFCHPPYFALYRYSSDVLRFELDWLGADRRAIRKREIEDGFKTTDAGLVVEHVADMARIAKEAARIGKPGSSFVVVTANSTLRKEPLSITEPFIDHAQEAGWHLVRHAIRKVRFAQASYHRSADADIQRPHDEVMIFSRR